MARNLTLYVLIMLVFGAGIFLLLESGSRLRPAASGSATASVRPTPTRSAKPGNGVIETLRENVKQPMSVLLLQIIVVVAAARMAGSVAKTIGQPAVVGEMAAGIMLGPSLLGALLPAAQQLIFAPSSLGGMRILSEVGVILFLFVVGLDLDLDHLRRKGDAAVLISHASIIIPFFLGISLSLFIFTPLAPANVSFGAFALFIGVAMSITAFPVLVRIIEERGLARSFLGTTAITCAAVDDATAWCLLAVVVTIARADGLWSAAIAILLVLLFVAAMLGVIKPMASRIIERRLGRMPDNAMIVYVLLFVFASALTTDLIGIHALFGAFLAGIALSSSERLRTVLKERVETFSSAFLLPLFFAFTGLRTQIGLLADWQSWTLCAAIVAVAIIGKLGGSMLAARWTGMDWHDAFSIGALMNTRGLVELIVLNLGYDLGILSPRIFTMLVIMALTTTFMTGPLLKLAELFKSREVLAGEPG